MTLQYTPQRLSGKALENSQSYKKLTDIAHRHRLSCQTFYSTPISPEYMVDHITSSMRLLRDSESKRTRYRNMYYMPYTPLALGRFHPPYVLKNY